MRGRGYADLAVTPVPSPVHPDALRALRGHHVQIVLTGSAGGGELTGRISGLLESADGLVLFLDHGDGRPVALHYHYVADIADGGLAKS